MAAPADRLARLLTLIPYARKHPGTPLEQLAHYVQSTPRQVTNDLNDVLMCGVPPYMPDDYIGVYMESDRVFLKYADHFRRPLTLTLNEGIALMILLDSHRPRREGSPEAECVRTIREKLGSILRAQGQQETAAATAASIQVRPARGGVSRTLGVIQNALDTRQKLAIFYHTLDRGQTTLRTVHPYGIIDHMGQWYLAAFCELRRDRRLFRVDRIKDARIEEGKTYQIPDDFDLETYKKERLFTGPARYKLKVRFDQTLARKILERYAHENPQVQANGDVVLEVDAASFDWAVPWLLKYGDRAEAIAPEPVRQRMIQAADNILALYQNADTASSPKSIP